MLSFLTALNQIAEPDIALRIVMQIISGGLASIDSRVLLGRRSNRQILPIGEKRWVGPHVGGFFICFALLYRRPRRQHVVVVLQCELNGFVESDCFWPTRLTSHRNRDTCQRYECGTQSKRRLFEVSHDYSRAVSNSGS